MKADESTPDLLTCDCGSILWAGCGVTGGQRLDETLLTCNDCGHEETVKQAKVDEVLDK